MPEDFDPKDYVYFRGVPVHTHSLDLPASMENFKEFLEGNDCPICKKQREEEKTDAEGN